MSSEAWRFEDPRGAAARALRAIAIGASAGGIDALRVLLRALPKHTAASVFVVVHVPPARPSMLAEVLRGRCALAVEEACDKQPVAAATVYVAPPDYHLLLDAGPQLALSTDPAVNYSRPSIDVLFESAADLFGDRACGVVLTGASDDGAAGLAAIERAGGLALVQDPATAMAPTMPRAALARCRAPQVFDLPRMAQVLSQLCKEARA